jgi:hypothetical protein
MVIIVLKENKPDNENLVEEYNILNVQKVDIL